MYMKSSVLLLLATSFVTPCYASNPFNKFIAKHHSANLPIVKNKKSAEAYTDFSGTWLAVCGKDFKQTIVIENDENYISMDGYEVKIGGSLNGVTEAGEGYHSMDYSSLSWNEDGSLSISSVGHDNTYADGASINTNMAKFTMTMKNNQITLEGKSIAYRGITPDVQISIHCLLTKK